MNLVKVLRSYAAHFRFLQEVADEPIGWIPRPKDIPSPYQFGATVPVWRWLKPRQKADVNVLIMETAHRRYEVFEVPGYVKIYENDDDAFEASRKEARR